jgi:hypothetical protein
MLSLIKTSRTAGEHGRWGSCNIVRGAEAVVLLLGVMLLVVEAKVPAVLAMLVSKDMRRHALVLEHCDDGRCRQLLGDAEVVVVVVDCLVLCRYEVLVIGSEGGRVFYRVLAGPVGGDPEQIAGLCGSNSFKCLAWAKYSRPHHITDHLFPCER